MRIRPLVTEALKDKYPLLADQSGKFDYYSTKKYFIDKWGLGSFTNPLYTDDKRVEDLTPEDLISLVNNTVLSNTVMVSKFFELREDLPEGLVIALKKFVLDNFVQVQAGLGSEMVKNYVSVDKILADLVSVGLVKVVVVDINDAEVDDSRSIMLFYINNSPILTPPQVDDLVASLNDTGLTPDELKSVFTPEVVTKINFDYGLLSSEVQQAMESLMKNYPKAMNKVMGTYIKIEQLHGALQSSRMFPSTQLESLVLRG